MVSSTEAQAFVAEPIKHYDSLQLGQERILVSCGSVPSISVLTFETDDHKCMVRMVCTIRHFGHPLLK